MSREGLTVADLKGIDLFDVDRALLITGMAGLGKTSTTDEWISSQLNEGEKYLRLSSTHILVNEVKEKYGNHCVCMTIAAGAYDCTGGVFYLKGREKEIPEKYKAVVFDEILQTHKNVYEYAQSLIGKVKVIITCDDHQQLAPEAEEEMLEAHNNFCNLPNVDVIRIKGSWRPIGPNRERTLDMYEFLYDAVEDNEMFTGSDLTYLGFKTCDIHDVKYTRGNMIDCHTNDIESWCYKYYEIEKYIFDRDDLVYKGGYRGSAPKKATTAVTVLSQNKVNKAKQIGSDIAQNYAQPKNIATAYRFQGIQVEQGNPYYKFIGLDSRISARELYTSFTRVRDIDDFKVVYVGHYTDDYNRKTFNGLPIRREKTLRVDYEKVLAEQFGDKEAKRASNSKSFLGYYLPKQISLQKMKDIINTYGKQLKDDEIYHARYIKDLSGDLAFYHDLDDTDYTEDTINSINDRSNRPPITARSAISKDSKYDYSYMGRVYSILDSKGLHEINAPRVTELTRDEYKKTAFYVDLWSCHVHILKFCEMPIDGIISTQYDPNMMNFYLCDGCNYVSGNTVIEDKFAKYLTDNNMCDVHYLFSVPKDIGSNMADRLYKMSHKDKESKATINEYVHWGYYEKPYIVCDGSNDVYATKNEAYNHQLLICAIYSQIYYYMFMLRDALNGKGIVTDACYFDELNNDTIDTIKSILPEGVDWRIRQQYYDSEGEWIRVDNNGKLERYSTVVYQTCKDLKHKDANKKANYRANMTDEQKAIQRERDRERKKAKYRENRIKVAKKSDK